MTEAEFQRRCVGWDRCEECGHMRPLIRHNQTKIDIKLRELYDNGIPMLLCLECVNDDTKSDQ